MSFNSIKGHQHQIRILTSALNGGTVAHAYLFTGLAGIGKMSVARTFAKVLNCTLGGEDCCDACTSCTMIDRGTHPDIQEIRPDGEQIKIAQIRSMQERLLYTRLHGTYRSVLLDGADAMNPQSANCLLKTIEEPPPQTVIILSTALPYRIPATIRSRCQRISFQPLASHLIEEVLQDAPGGGKPALVSLASSLAGGSLGRALRFMETDVLTRRQQLLALLARSHAPDLTALLDYADEAGEDRETLLELLDFFRLWIRDLMVAKESGRAHGLINTDCIDEILAAAPRLSWSHLLQQGELVADVQSALKGAVNPRIALERMLFTARAAISYDAPPNPSPGRTDITT